MSKEPLDFKVWKEKKELPIGIALFIVPIFHLLLPIFVNLYFGPFLLKVVLWAVYSIVTWVAIAVIFAVDKEKYEVYLQEFYEKQKALDASNAQEKARLDAIELEAKEAQLLKELYALRHTSQDSSSLDDRLKSLEAELDKEKKITALEAELKTETAMRNKYKDMALDVKKQVH